MFAPMLLAQVPDAATGQQPTSMEVVGYQRVQHALPDGRPDPSATDNYYVRTRSQWFLMADSDTLPINDKGQHHIVFPERFTREYKIDNQFGELGKGPFGIFKELNYINPEDRGKQVKSSWGRMAGMNFFRPASQRMLLFHIRTVVDQVEIRSVGKKSAIRTSRHSHWGVSSQGWTSGKPFLPKPEPQIYYESTAGHVYEPPVYGYGQVVVPKDYDL
ncbi:hypothetical protein EON81_14215 [bacterium]|nr:MAG: hypothetical protein EON81_14215 [bacterium]